MRPPGRRTCLASPGPIRYPNTPIHPCDGQRPTGTCSPAVEGNHRCLEPLAQDEASERFSPVVAHRWVAGHDSRLIQVHPLEACRHLQEETTIHGEEACHA